MRTPLSRAAVAALPIFPKRICTGATSPLLTEWQQRVHNAQAEKPYNEGAQGLTDCDSSRYANPVDQRRPMTMVNTQPLHTLTLPATPPCATPAQAPAAPSAEAPAADTVRLGAEAPSALYRFGRGLAATVGGSACAVVGGGLGGVKHAGDQSIKVPRALVRSAAIGGAALGLAHGIVAGLSAGPVGLAVGVLAGPTLGAFIGGGAVMGAATAVDAVKGSFVGAKEGFQSGYGYVSDVIDRMAGRTPASTCECGSGCDCASPAPPAATAPPSTSAPAASSAPPAPATEI